VWILEHAEEREENGKLLVRFTRNKGKVKKKKIRIDNNKTIIFIVGGDELPPEPSRRRDLAKRHVSRVAIDSETLVVVVA